MPENLQVERLVPEARSAEGPQTGGRIPGNSRIPAALHAAGTVELCGAAFCVRTSELLGGSSRHISAFQERPLRPS
jgi:hypothetical protein